MISERKFVLAGKACFTLTDSATGKHYTYRVNRITPESKFKAEPMWFVNLGINYSESVYVGLLGGDRERPFFKLTARSRFSSDTPTVKTFMNFWGQILRDEDLAGIRFQHAGRCCVCSRELTNPESIEAGIGPECSGKE